MNYLQELYVKFLLAVKSEKGQTLVEYALLLLLIAIVVILMVKGVGTTANQEVGSEPCRSVSQGVECYSCLPKNAWPSDFRNFM